MTDVIDELEEGKRAVGTRRLPGGEARTVTITHTYGGGVEEVWDACTNPERIPRWFLPVSGDLRVGGRYQLEGNAGGTIERCEPPQMLAATWEYGQSVSWIELRLTDSGSGRTTLELTHIAAIEDGGHWAQFGPGATGVGWDLGLMGLRRHLASGESVDREQAAAWSASEPAREFMSQSSRLWGEAAIAAGEPAESARAAAGRTTAFYLGEPAPGRQT
jgi:uncharacterized protein YndB with AHSA1/START domain